MTMTTLGVMCHVSQWSGLVWNPTSAIDANYDASIFTCSHILAAFRGVDSFRSAKHESVISEVVKTELKFCNEAKCESEKTLLTSKLCCDDRRTILQGQATGQWMLLLPSTVKGTKFSGQELFDMTLYLCGVQGILQTYHHGVMVATKS
jgi:hypothetical protein